MGSILIKNAKAIVTLDGQDTVLENKNILIRDHCFNYIGDDCFEADEVIDAQNVHLRQHRAETLDPPGVTLPRHHLPAIQRIAP